MNIDFPFGFDTRGRTTPTDDDDHIRDMIEQLLFTAPGERVNRPDFGSGLLQMVFAPNSPELAAALQFTTQAAVQRYLGDLIDLQQLDVTAEDATLSVTVRYVVRATQQAQQASFTRSSAMTDARLLHRSVSRRAAPRGQPAGAAARPRLCRGRSTTQTVLEVFFLGRAPQNADRRSDHTITGGRPVRVLRHQGASPEGSDLRRLVQRHGRSSGRFLDLHAVDCGTRRQAAGRLRSALRHASVSTSRRPADSDLDCKPEPICPPPELPTPPIDYLAKDYDSFRQLMLDRLAVTMPAWQETHAPDIGVMLVELLAYAGDQLSATTRTRSRPRRISARRATASRCDATRGWSTTPCTKAAMRGRSCISIPAPTRRSMRTAISSSTALAGRRAGRGAARQLCRRRRRAVRAAVAQP